MAEQLIRNEQVAGSIPVTSSIKTECSQNKRTAPISTNSTNWGSSNLIIGFIYKSHQKPFTVNTITSVADLSSRSSVIIVMMLPSESNAELQNQG